MYGREREERERERDVSCIFVPNEIELQCVYGEPACLIIHVRMSVAEERVYVCRKPQVESENREAKKNRYRIHLRHE